MPSPKYPHYKSRLQEPINLKMSKILRRKGELDTKLNALKSETEGYILEILEGCDE